MVKAPLARRVRSLATVISGSALLAVVLPVQAQAATAGSALIASSVANIAVATDCARIGSSLFTTTQIAGSATLISRPSAKPMSALERMRMQQAMPAIAAIPTGAAMPGYGPVIASVADAALVPAATGGHACGALFDSARPGLVRAPALGASTSPARKDFLESRILPVSTTAFDTDWNRVAGRGDTAAVRKAALSLAASDGSRADQIGAVNTFVNRAVAYTPDSALYGRRDYWATAGETLTRGKGDCEDFAIAKMEILAAMGVARKDMFLTIARDLVRQDDHAVLIVKLEGRSILLDNATDLLIDGDVANDYRPILSFNADKRFLHGY